MARAFVILLGIMTGHALLETARDALFLSRLPATRLPWVYLAIAAVSLLVTRLPLGALGRSLSAMLGGAAIITAGFWAVVDHPDETALYALYVWSGVLITLVLTQFWTRISDLFTVTQAKRLYALIGAGSVAGAIAGSGLAGVMARLIEARHLTLMAAGALAITALGARTLPRPMAAVSTPTRRNAPSNRNPAGRWAVARHPYARRIAALAVISTVTLTLGDYLFKATLAAEVPAELLGQRFAEIYFALNVISLLIQLFVVGWAVRRLSVNGALMVLPVALAIGAAGVVVGLGMAAALALKGADGTLKHSLHRTASELAFVPMAERLRRQVKAFIDVVGQRGGQALASVLILCLAATVDPGPMRTTLGAATLGLALVWLAVAVGLRGHYLELFRTTLREGHFETRLEFPELDMGGLESLMAALNSTDDARVIAAVDLLSAQGRTHIIPALLLYHPSIEVVDRAATRFAEAGRIDFVPIADRLMRQETSGLGTRGATLLRAVSAVDPNTERFERFAEAPCPEMRSTALVGLAATGELATEEALERLRELLAMSNPLARAAVARAIAHQPARFFEPLLVEMARDPDADVRLAASEAMEAMGSPGCIDALLPLLADRHVRSSARAALLTLGEAALPALDQALGDVTLPHSMRIHLPRTVGRFRSQAAVDVLMGHLLSTPEGGVRYKILRGLNRLAIEQPDLRFDPAILDKAITANLKRAFRVLDDRLTLTRGADDEPSRQTGVQALLLDLLRDKEYHAVERIVRLLALRHRREDFSRIWRGLKGRNATRVASSRELLAHVVEPPFRAAILALTDDASDPERLDRGAAFHTPHQHDYDGALARLLTSHSASLRALAVRHIAEIGAESLKPRLEALAAAEQAALKSRMGRATDLPALIRDALEHLARPRAAVT